MSYGLHLIQDPSGSYSFKGRSFSCIEDAFKEAQRLGYKIDNLIEE